jgi:hypothetical protein
MGGSSVINEPRERAELEAVLASALFVRAPYLAKILKYICEKHFSNHADTIKEYSIAVEALDRRPDFRAEEDSIVRVQVSRLRKHLQRYYETDGVAHPLQIRLSSTGYRPEFFYATTPEGQAAGPADSSSLEAIPPPSVPDESEPGSVSESRAALEQPGAPPSHSSRRTLAWTLTLVATVSILAVVGVTAIYRSGTSSAKIPSALPTPPNATPGISIRAGLGSTPSVDVAGGTWLADCYFTGGAAFSQTGNQILRTFDQSLYQTGRRGSFSYAVPLPQGVYELHLHFAEVFWPLMVGADTQREFDVSINGVPLMPVFDIAKDAGGVYIADEKVFKDVSPAKDGFLRLNFVPRRNRALLNAIEVLPGVRGKMLPVRILCSNHSYFDRNGQFWKADRYFSGGWIAELIDSIQDPSFGSFSSYRTGNFNYAIPVADGSYRLRLLFAEPVFGRNGPPKNDVGGRLFDIYCNGRTLVSGLDILKTAGGAYRVVEETYHRVKPDAQGKILLSFVPVRNYAVLLAIEVLDENW